MEQIMEEYGSGIIAMICVIALVSIASMLVFGNGSPVSDAVAEFAKSICGGGE